MWSNYYGFRFLASYRHMLQIFPTPVFEEKMRRARSIQRDTDKETRYMRLLADYMFAMSKVRDMIALHPRIYNENDSYPGDEKMEPFKELKW